MAYPREVYLSEEAEQALKTQLIFNLTNHRAERSAWVEELRRLQWDYWATPKSEIQKFPFQNASSIIIPLSAIVTEAVTARLLQRLFSLDHLVACKFNDALWSQFDRAIERCLDWQLLKQMELRARIEDAILECVKLGTMVIKTGYKRLTKNVEINDQIVETVQYQGPWFDCVPLVNFLMPFTSQDPQTADWCGEEHADNQYNILLMEKSGLFRPGTYQKLEGYFGSLYAQNLSSRPYKQDTEKLQKQQPVWPQKSGWYELYMPVAYDKNDPSKKKEMVVLYHFDSNTILSIRDNWDEGRRPYIIGQYIKVEHRWTGIGVCKQNEQFQKEVTTQHRQRLDAGTLANANMIKVKKLSNISPNEPVFPGKIWFVDEMDEIDTFQLGGIYPQASNNEQQTLYYAQQRSGINELTLGMPQVGTPGTATSDMARVQESGIKFDYNYNNVKIALGRLVTDIVCNISRYGLSDERYYDTVPEGNILRQFFSLPANLHRSGVICSFEVVGQSANKMLDRQNWQTLQQIFTGYYQNAMVIAQMTGNPQLMMAVAMQNLNASTLAMKQVLESFDIPNPDKLTLAPLINGLLPTVPGTDPTGQSGIGTSPTSPQAGIQIPPSTPG